jgi:hypothetical protein
MVDAGSCWRPTVMPDPATSRAARSGAGLHLDVVGSYNLFGTQREEAAVR